MIFWVWSRIKKKFFLLKILKLFVSWLKSFSASVQKWITFIFFVNLWLQGYFHFLVVVGSGIRDPGSELESGSRINNPDSYHCPWPANTEKVIWINMFSSIRCCCERPVGLVMCNDCTSIRKGRVAMDCPVSSTKLWICNKLFYASGSYFPSQSEYLLN